MSVAPKPFPIWPLWLLASGAFVAVWSGWVGLGGLTGFGVIHPLPGIWDDFTLNTAITLPIGLETYAAYALGAWLSGRAPAGAKRFAKWSAIGSLTLGAAGQIAFHLLAAPENGTPWGVTMAVACLPVAVLGMGAALAHLMRVRQSDAVADVALDVADVAGDMSHPVALSLVSQATDVADVAPRQATRATSATRMRHVASDTATVRRQATGDSDIKARRAAARRRQRQAAKVRQSDIGDSDTGE